jgi:hypothetical protein
MIVLMVPTDFISIFFSHTNPNIRIAKLICSALCKGFETYCISFHTRVPTGDVKYKIADICSDYEPGLTWPISWEMTFVRVRSGQGDSDPAFSKKRKILPRFVPSLFRNVVTGLIYHLARVNLLASLIGICSRFK